ncbi:MAG: PAS domain S-box protein [Candidatus Omnitrophota bacterium]
MQLNEAEELIQNLQEELRIAQSERRQFELKLEEQALVCSRAFVENERRRMQELMDRTDEKYRILMESANDAIFVADAEKGIILEANKKAEELIGRPAQEIIGHHYSHLHPPDKMEEIQRGFQDAAQKSNVLVTKEYYIQHRDGRQIPVEISSNVIELGGKKLIQGIFRDLTERKRAEKTLRDSEEHFRSLFENMLNGFAFCKMLYEHDQPVDFVYLEVNRNFETLTGLKNVVGKKVSEVIPGIREKDPNLFEIYGRTALTGVPEKFETYVDALNMWFSISVYSPQKEYIVAVFDVITERKRAERKILHLNSVLRAIRKINQIITKEKDRQKLLDKTCACFVEAQGFHHACIVLMDEDGKIQIAAAAGLGEEFKRMLERMDRGDAPECARKALSQPGVFVSDDPYSLCGVIPKTDNSRRLALTIRLEHEGMIYGLMSVAEPENYAAEVEDQSLIQEIADDIAFALYNIEMEEMRCKLEESVFQAREFYLKLFEDFPAMIWRSGIDGKCNYFNKVWLSFTGRTMEQEIGDGWAEGVHPDDIDRCLRIYLGAFSNREPFEMVYRLRRYDGEYRYIFDIGRPYCDLDNQFAGYIGSCFDITEHKEMEDALRQNEARLSEAQRIAHLGHWEWDEATGQLHWSDEVFRIFGLPPQDGFLTYEMFLEIIHPEDREFVERSSLAARFEGKPYDLDHRIVRPDGSERIVHEHAEIMYGSSGEPVRMIGTVQDITDRELVKRKILDSEALYHSLVENLPQCILRKDLQGHFTFANKRSCKEMGKSLEEIVGKTDYDFFPPELADKYLRDDRRVIETGEIFETVEEHQIPGGERIYVQVMKTPLYNAAGKIVGIQILFWDVTKQKRSEDALRESEERYRQFFEDDLTGDFINAADGRLIDCNPAYVRIFGFASVDEALGSNARDIYLNPKDRVQFLDFLKEKKRLLNFERTLRRKDGKIVNTIENLIGIFGENGELTGIRGYVFDITDRKLLEEQYRQAQKMEAVGRLAGGIAHDFNNLVMAIKGYCDFALKKLAEDHPAQEDILEVKKAGDRTAALTRQLLAFSRKQVLQTQYIDLSRVIVGMDKMLRRLIGEDIELATLPNPAKGIVKADPGQIEQIIMNLAVNARDAMPQGGKLTIETQNVVLDEAYVFSHIHVKPGPYVMLAISDTGKGMDEETRSRLFEPFFTTKEVGKGTGLGLATVYGIVKQSDGYIWVYSEPGKGATFKIYLPRIEGAEEKPLAPPTPFESLKGRETVMVVEDEASVRNLVSRSLNYQGYAVLTANSGGEALQICEKYLGPVHLLVTDVVMPGMNGRDLARQLLARYPEMKTIFMSGYTENAIVHHGVLEENLVFMQKPFIVDDLLRKVRETLEAS